ncbi:hypothetical protein CDAR_619531 [Caerostris darwini]|uniref:Uncharacterized protein n=1 Tax=Caerostris darwini TaxID=1538125 RepID=A0AAV4QVL1_9ARAC|nr:hypothetical protein CDAR_619531 [Caerostris darwini]
METSVHIDQTAETVTWTNTANLTAENNCNSKEKKISKTIEMILSQIMETSVHIDQTAETVTWTNTANLTAENNCNSKEKKISKSTEMILSQVTPQRKWGDIYANYTWQHSATGNKIEYEETGLMSWKFIAIFIAWIIVTILLLAFGFELYIKKNIVVGIMNSVSFIGIFALLLWRYRQSLKNNEFHNNNV